MKNPQNNCVQFETHFDVAVELMLSCYNIIHSFDARQDRELLFRSVCGNAYWGGVIENSNLYLCKSTLYNFFDTVPESSGLPFPDENGIVDPADSGWVRICKYDGKASQLKFAEGVEYRVG